MMEASASHDAELFAKMGQAQLLNAQANRMNAQAARTKEAATAINAFVAAQTQGVALPKGLLQMLQGDD
jgi:hypothetical protein